MVDVVSDSTFPSPVSMHVLLQLQDFCGKTYLCYQLKANVTCEDNNDSVSTRKVKAEEDVTASIY